MTVTVGKVIAGILIGILVLFVIYVIFSVILFAVGYILIRRAASKLTFTREPEKSGVLKDLPYAKAPTSQAEWQALGMQWFTAIQSLYKKLFTGNDENRKLQPELERAGIRFAKRIVLSKIDKDNNPARLVDNTLKEFNSYNGTQRGNEAIVYLLKAAGVPIPPLIHSSFPIPSD